MAGWLAGNHPPEELSQIQQQAKEGNFLNKIEKNKNSCAYMLTTLLEPISEYGNFRNYLLKI